MLGRIFAYAEDRTGTVSDWLLAFFSVTFIRTFLENFSSKNPQSYMTVDVETVLHYTLFYAVTVLSLAVGVHSVVRKDIYGTLKVFLIGLPIIWLPPLVDLVVSGGKGIEMAYLFESAEGLLQNFGSFFGAHSPPGVTIGIRIELVLILSAIGCYVYWCTKHIAKSIGAVVLSYGILFVLLSAPSFLAFGYDQVWLYFVLLGRDSLTVQNFFDPWTAFPSSARLTEMYFNVIMSSIAYLMLIPLLTLFAYLWDSAKLSAIIRNSRPERVGHYFAMILLGMWIAYSKGLWEVSVHSWLDCVSVGALFAAYYFAWMFAVGVNDLVDRDSDARSNVIRPLVTGELAENDVRTANVLFFILAFLGAYLAGAYTLFLVGAFTALYFVYSSPPLQLKRYTILNSFIISLCALSAVVSGFFALSADHRIAAFPVEWFFLIVVVYTLIANVKDIKDIAGDRAAQVYTIPVIYGEKNGRRIIGAMVAGALAIVPLVTGIIGLWYIVPFFCAASYMLIVRDPFRERSLFYLYFFFLAVAAFVA